MYCAELHGLFYCFEKRVLYVGSTQKRVPLHKSMYGISKALQSNEPSVTNMQFETNAWLTTSEGGGFDIQDDFGLSFVTYFNTLSEAETLSDRLATIISQSLYGNCAIGKASSDGRHQDTRNFFSLRRWW